MGSWREEAWGERDQHNGGRDDQTNGTRKTVRGFESVGTRESKVRNDAIKPEGEVRAAGNFVVKREEHNVPLKRGRHL